MTSRTFRQATILFLLAALSLPLFACALSDAVQKVAELIDKAACRIAIGRMPDVEFSRYLYATDACYGRTGDSNEILVYQTLKGSHE